VDWIQFAQNRDQWQTCENGNEPSNSIKDWEISLLGQHLLTFQREF